MSDTLNLAENERRFVAQELHDSITQTLLQMNMQISICKRYQEIGFYMELGDELDGLEAQINTVSQQLRRLIADLRPPVSDDGAFDSILQKQIKTHHERGGPPVSLTQSGRISLSGYKKLALARIIQEALANIRKHARATQVEMALTVDDQQCQLTVSDDGVGFDDALVPNPLSEKGGAGMIGMYSRANAVGGEFDIKSQPGQGVTIQVTIPL